MVQMVAYHFHGYQPGDIVRRLAGSPQDPLRWEERKSPVALRVGESRITGRNWTDCMFSCYDVFMNLFNSMARELGEGVCSVDIEPFTLEMLLRKDRLEDRNIYGRIMEVFERRIADPVLTIPFHPILPYLHPFEQEVLAGVAHDFYAPLMQSLEASGIWLPEGAYTRQAATIVASAFPLTPGGTGEPYFVLDGRQFLEPSGSYHLWSLNYIDLEARRAFAFGRDMQLSDAYSFGGTPIKDLVNSIVEDKVDAVKEKRGIPYLITLASDLEALVGGPRQVERFRDLISTLKARGTTPITHGQFLRGKLSGKLERWEGEGEAPAFRAVIKDFSSWSDYHDQTVGGRTSDTRWQGMRRVDGLVISRAHGRRRISQLWKQGFLAMEAAVEAEVRRAFGRVLRAVARETTRDKAKGFLVGYGRTIFREHHLRQGRSLGECSPQAAMDQHLGSVEDPEALALAARAYYEMLMGLRSDPCFWENLDTRVTFQNVLFLAYALLDMAEALRRVGEPAAAEGALGLLRTHLVGFENAYHLFRLGSLTGHRGWETQEDAWIAALQSEVPRLSAYNCVKRAALFALGDAVPEFPAVPLVNPSLVVAATGHIQGEGHGLWEERAHCEHRISRA